MARCQTAAGYAQTALDKIEQMIYIYLRIRFHAQTSDGMRMNDCAEQMPATQGC